LFFHAIPVFVVLLLSFRGFVGFLVTRTSFSKRYKVTKNISILQISGGILLCFSLCRERIFFLTSLLGKSFSF